MLCKESCRPDGPRGHYHKADFDFDVEKFLASRLTPIYPAYFVGEETCPRPGEDSPYCWLVDPHDGTSAYLEGFRGTAVSVALLRSGVPVLGVVCAPMSPDRGWDLIAWAEGSPHLLRNSTKVCIDLSSEELESGQIVFLNHRSAATPVGSGMGVMPARFVSLPSIAYRLARVAVGDGVAAVSTNAPCGLDFVAGHALLRGAGGVLLNESGQEVTYSQHGSAQTRSCFGGAPKVARALAARSWPSPSQDEPSRERALLSWPRMAIDDEVDRAAGCLFGQVIGDSLGGLVEFLNEERIAQLYPNGPLNLEDGGCWRILAGQATDDSELALAHALLTRTSYDAETIATAYGDWLASGPFDVGSTTSRALSAALDADPGRKAKALMSRANADSESNGSLMRIAPVGIWARHPAIADWFARVDSRLTHPNRVCADACGVFAAAVAEGIRTGDHRAMFRVARAYAQTKAIGKVLDRAEKGEFPKNYSAHMGWVLIALQNAFCHLLSNETFEDALVSTVRKGGDTDTNGAIAGALLGAACGSSRMPPRWTIPVMACLPHSALGAFRPRPTTYWPDSLAEIAEALHGAINAFGGVLIDEKGRILLREPAGHYGGYAWTFAKGRPRPGERPDEAALRDVREETGYEARITGMIPDVFPGDTSITAFFLMEPVGEQRPFGSETARTVWVNLDEATRLVEIAESAAGRSRDLSVIAAMRSILSNRKSPPPQKVRAIQSILPIFSSA